MTMSLGPTERLVSPAGGAGLLPGAKASRLPPAVRSLNTPTPILPSLHLACTSWCVRMECCVVRAACVLRNAGAGTPLPTPRARCESGRGLRGPGDATHGVEEDGAFRRCRRCKGAVPLARGASAFVGRRCPVWHASCETAEVGAEHDWGVEVALLLGVRAAGVRARVAELPLPQTLPRPSELPGGLPRLLRWQPHTALLAEPGVICLQCGRRAPAWATLAASPCVGWRERLPPMGRASLLAGRRLRAGGPQPAFEAALAARLAERPGLPR